MGGATSTDPTVPHSHGTHGDRWCTGPSDDLRRDSRPGRRCRVRRTVTAADTPHRPADKAINEFIVVMSWAIREVD